jgi:hypothetical protein
VYETYGQKQISVTFEKNKSVEADSGFAAHTGSVVSDLQGDSPL